MTAELSDPSFWSDQSDSHKIARGFTSFFGERAWSLAKVPAGARVLDIAAGAGALAIVAARAGSPVLATDFSPGMVDAVLSQGLPNLEARAMDGQALDLPDASFDAAFSLFGIMLFPDWRAGLREMARVVRPGGIGCIGTWKEPSGAAANLLLARLCGTLFPEMVTVEPHAGLNELHDPHRLAEAMNTVGFQDVSIEEVVTDFPIDAAAIAKPDLLFQFSPRWPQLDEARREAILAPIRAALVARGGVLPIPSPALIAFAHKR
jgi:ubiquinone/menaquinone biosynthesis C-methylase UbiE